MKRRESLKLAGGSTLTLVPAVDSWVYAGTVEEVDDVMVESSISVDDIKRAIACLYKNKCQPIQPMNEFFFYASEDVYEDVAKKVETYNQNYLKLRNSRW